LVLWEMSLFFCICYRSIWLLFFWISISSFFFLSFLTSEKVLNFITCINEFLIYSCFPET
jgi:hypothetical protein